MVGRVHCFSCFINEDTEAQKDCPSPHSLDQGVSLNLVYEADVLPNTPFGLMRTISNYSQKTDLSSHAKELKFNIRKNILALKANIRMDKPKILNLLEKKIKCSLEFLTISYSRKSTGIQWVMNLPILLLIHFLKNS